MLVLVQVLDGLVLDWCSAGVGSVQYQVDCIYHVECMNMNQGHEKGF